MAIVILEYFDESNPIATQENFGDFITIALEPYSLKDIAPQFLFRILINENQEHNVAPSSRLQLTLLVTNSQNL